MADLIRREALQVSEARLPVKTYLVCGFLGAGKTTFILDYLKVAGSNVAVLVNEFGQLGIDGEIIKDKGGIDVVEMPGGCICCSQKQDLIESAGKIAGDLKPDLILIEPSGVAEASEIIKTLSDKSLKGVIRLDAVIAVIDATTFIEFSDPEAFGTFFLDQVENADIVIVNKEDLVDGEELSAVQDRVAQISPEALMIATSYGQLSAALPDVHRKDEIMSHKSGIKFSSISVEIDHVMPHNAVENLLTELIAGTFGDVIRAKGFLSVEGYGSLNLQLSPSGASVQIMARDVLPRLTVIGSNLKEDLIQEYFNGSNE